MPVGDYLGSEGFSAGLTQTDIELHFSLSELDRRAVGRHRRAMNRQGIALQIGYLRLTGLPLNSVEMIPEPVLTHLGRELGIAVPRLASIRGL